MIDDALLEPERWVDYAVTPERLTADPRTGRLTLNGFFTCRRNLA